MPRQLTPAAQEDRAEFERYADHHGCSCHLTPPCDYCTHPGNPLNQNEDDDAWEDVPDEPENGIMQYNSQWQERIGWRLFPSKHIDAPKMEGAKDVVIACSYTHLSWLDRIRVLISGTCAVTVKTTTENIVGKSISISAFEVRPPKFLQRKD